MNRLIACCGLCLTFVASTVVLAAPPLDSCSVFTISDANALLGSGAERMTTHTPANKPPGVLQESTCQYLTDLHIGAVVLLVFSTGSEAQAYQDQMAKLPIAVRAAVGVKGSIAVRVSAADTKARGQQAVPDVPLANKILTATLAKL